jgi:hypothetical protein
MLTLSLADRERVRKYRRYRDTAMALASRIADAEGRSDALREAGAALGLLAGKEKAFIFEDESEMAALMDYSLFEFPSRENNAIRAFLKGDPEIDEIERQLLAAMLEAATGLFMVEEARPRSAEVTLRRIVGPPESIAITDTSLSQFAIEGAMVFVRPIVLPEFVMTSGVMFPFPPSMAPRLIKKWVKSPAAKRFPRFFRLHRSEGIPVIYA